MKYIASLIGECTAYDKKVALEAKKPRSWLKSISAFANGDGGALIFGIADNDEVVGLMDAREVVVLTIVFRRPYHLKRWHLPNCAP